MVHGIASVNDRAFMPTMFVVQFLTWIGMFMLWLFTLPLVANLLGKNGGLGSSIAIRWVGYCFALYVALAAIIGLTLPAIYDRIGKNERTDWRCQSALWVSDQWH